MSLEEAISVIGKRWPAVHIIAQEEPVFVLAAGYPAVRRCCRRILLRKCLVWGEPYGLSGFIARMAESLESFSANWPEENALIFTSPWWQGPMRDDWTSNLYPPVQCLLDAHVEFFRKLFAEPSLARGYAQRWGLKEVRYGMEHAVFLHWLFPKAKFLFLVSNPYECWASYSRLKIAWQRFWPEPRSRDPGSSPVYIGPVSSKAAAITSRRCAAFRSATKLLVRGDFDMRPLAEYLGFEPDPAPLKMWIGASPPGAVAPEEMERLQKVVGPMADRLGYSYRILPRE